MRDRRAVPWRVVREYNFKFQNVLRDTARGARIPWNCGSASRMFLWHTRTQTLTSLML